VIKGRVGDPVDDLLEPAVILVGFDGEMEGLLDVVQVFDGFRRQGGPDFLEEGLQGFIEGGILEHLQHVPAEIEGHQFGQGKGDRHLVLDRIQQGPEILSIHPFGIDGEAGNLEGFEVPVNGPGIAVQPLSQF